MSDDDDPLGHLIDDIEDDDSSDTDQEPPRFEDSEQPPGADDQSADQPDHPVDHNPSRDDEQSASGSRSGPLGDLAADLDDRSGRTEPAEDTLFDEESVPEIDAETVWEQVEAGADEDGQAGPTIDPEERTERVIDTGTYCERCEYFSEPPDVHCTHEGTEIVEMVDIDHFRVVDCPIVLENERLEKL